MAEGEMLVRRIKTPANARTPLEFWTFGTLRALFREDQPALELIPAGATPEIPKRGRVVLFARDNGAGKTQICCLHPSGEVGILYTEA